MLDQATQLRKLVLRAMRDNPAMAGPPPRLLLLVGGQAGVGVTSVAVNLSVALSEQGSRVVIVDADPARPDVARLCGLPESADHEGTVHGTRDIHEVLQRGPAGIQVVPGLASAVGLLTPDTISEERLHRQLLTLGRHADIVVIDVGSATNSLARRFSRSASDVLLLTTPDDSAVMASYACIKTMLPDATDSVLRLVVNRSDCSVEARDVHHRVADSCEKFLDRTVEFACRIPFDPAVSQAAVVSTPFLLALPESGCSQAINQLALQLTARPAMRQSA